MSELLKINNVREGFKDSGNPFIGKIPRHWKIVPLFSIAKVKSITNCSKRQLLSVYLNQGVIRFSDVKEKRTNVTSLDTSKYQRVDVGDFVLNNQQAWRGSVGVSKYKGKVSPAYIVLELSESISEDYANYLFRNKCSVSQYLISSKGVGTIQRNLYYPYLKRMDVVLPPKPEQTAIANFLEDKTAKIDQAIAQKERMIELLQERKQIIIQNAVTKGLDPNVKMKDSGVEWIGEIPEHWGVARNHAVYSESNREGRGDLPILSVSIHSAVSNEELSGEENIQGRNRIANKSNYKLVRHDDIVFNMMRAWQGAIGAVRVNEGLVSPAYIVASPLGTVCSDYIEYLFRTSVFIQEVNRFSKGITDFRKRLYWDEFKNLRIVLPPIEEQHQISNHLNTVIEKTDLAISTYNKQIDKLKEYKTTLIDHAVTGKIKVT